VEALRARACLDNTGIMIGGLDRPGARRRRCMRLQASLHYVCVCTDLGAITNCVQPTHWAPWVRHLAGL
jgi:hypothetical protein